MDCGKKCWIFGCNLLPVAVVVEARVFYLLFAKSRDVGVADVEWNSGETAAEFSGVGMEVVGEGVGGGAVHALGAFAMREIAVRGELNPRVLEDYKRDWSAAGLV